MEKISKNRKGRPVKLIFFKNNFNFYKNLEPDLTTRQLYNRYYETVALSEIIVDWSTKKIRNPIFKYLYDFDAKANKKTVLSAIGRVFQDYGKDDAVYVATMICQNKMNTTTALNFISDVRGLRQNKIEGTIDKLLTVIQNARLNANEIIEVQTVFNKIISDKINE
jgi:hypothetical protein